jgi:hypothetical protein
MRNVTDVILPRVSNTEPLTLRKGNQFGVFENRMAKTE